VDIPVNIPIIIPAASKNSRTFYHHGGNKTWGGFLLSWRGKVWVVK